MKFRKKPIVLSMSPIVLSMSLVWDDGTRTRPFKVPVRVESVPGGVTWWPLEPSMATIPNPGHKTASGVWYYLNDVPWHFSEDWTWNKPSNDPVYVYFDGPIVDLS